MIEECDIFHLLGLGVSQIFLPVSQSKATISAFPPVAMIALLSSSKAHCPVYHKGTSVLYSFSMSTPHLKFPFSRSRHITSHLGPILKMYLSEIAGMVLDIPWFLLIAISYHRLHDSFPSTSEKHFNISARLVSS